jgi:nucleotide-binding universal stress UspA family protein
MLQVRMSAAVQVLDQKSLTFKHILIATDFSPASEETTACALAMARRYHSQVTVVHALAPTVRESVPLDSPRELDGERIRAEQQMAMLAEKTEKMGVSSRFRIERGHVWDILSPLIQGNDVDLLVVGTHGRGTFKKMALGSVAEEVLRRAECPVLTIGPNVANADSSVLRRILFATDFGPASVKAFPYALSLAQSQSAKLVFVHMIAPVPTAIAGFAPTVCAAQDLAEWEATAKRDSIRNLNQLIPRGTKLEMPPEYVVGLGFLPDGILDAAAEHEVDLIVMGANRSDSARVISHIPWSVTYDVMCEARCPVLTVRG